MVTLEHLASRVPRRVRYDVADVDLVWRGLFYDTGIAALPASPSNNIPVTAIFSCNVYSSYLLTAWHTILCPVCCASRRAMPLLSATIFFSPHYHKLT